MWQRENMFERFLVFAQNSLLFVVMLKLFVCLTELDNKATLSDHILTAVLGLLKKEVPEHGRHLQQYFHFFLMYSMIGPPEVCILISVQLTWPSRSSQSLLNRCIGLKGNWSFRYKSFPYELKQWNCTKIWITSSKVCNWTRKTFWVNILRSLSQRISLYRNDFVPKRPKPSKKCLRRYRCSAGIHL